MSEPAAEQDHDIEELLVFLRDSRGFDFTGYKRSSLTRRIRKRMQDVRIAEYADYRDMLEADADEFRSLFNTILINVTGFFRDPTAWQYVQSHVLPDLLAMSSQSEEVRVWSAGCSTGEEAYSLAISFAEMLGVPETTERVKIYATDVDEDALHRARAGSYPEKSLAGLPDGIREKYFEPSGPEYVFRPDLRRRVIFGRHDITQDAPISRLHLLVCRNTLMYFNVEAQSQVIDRFHFALRAGGYLFLGKAEMLLSDGERFEVASMRQRIFRRRPGEAVLLHQPATIRFETANVVAARDETRRRQLRDLVLDADPSALIVIDVNGTVTLINSQARAAFGLSGQDIGRPFRDLEVSYRPAELRSLIERVHAERRALRVNSVERHRGVEDIQYFDVLIHPLSAPDGATLGCVLVFMDTTHQTRLQHELKRSREDLETAHEELQSTNEELETTNEELQSSIEELETTNEELQSTNEELETTNEELQSGNEELETMNEEMRIRTTELDEARTFLEGVLSSVAGAVIVLDAHLAVRSWNRGAQDMWGLRSDEVVGQSFFDLEFGLPTERLRDAVEQCIAGGRRSNVIEMQAVNRLGHGIVCIAACSPLDGRPGTGAVLLVEEVRREPR